VPRSRPGGRCGPVDRARLDRGAAGRLGLPERGAVDLGVDEPHINHALYRWRPSWGSAAALPTMPLFPAPARPFGRRQPSPLTDQRVRGSKPSICAALLPVLERQSPPGHHEGRFEPRPMWVEPVSSGGASELCRPQEATLRARAGKADTRLENSRPGRPAGDGRGSTKCLVLCPRCERDRAVPAVAGMLLDAPVRHGFYQCAIVLGTYASVSCLMWSGGNQVGRAA
jgi:hypothetical protein